MEFIFLKNLESGFWLEHGSTTKKNPDTGGLLNAVASSKIESKSDEPLKYLEPQVDPRSKLISFYKSAFLQKGKEVMVLNENIDSLNLKEFDKSQVKSGKYFVFDVRFLKPNMKLTSYWWFGLITD